MLNWNKLKKTYEDLTKTSGLNADSEITFVVVLLDGKIKKTVVQFRQFLDFFWLISEKKDIKVAALVVQDSEGRILYRYKKYTPEEIPDGGNGSVILNWEALQPEEKNTFIKVLVAQIQGYEK